MARGPNPAYQTIQSGRQLDSKNNVGWKCDFYFIVFELKAPEVWEDSRRQNIVCEPRSAAFIVEAKITFICNQRFDINLQTKMSVTLRSIHRRLLILTLVVLSCHFVPFSFKSFVWTEDQQLLWFSLDIKPPQEYELTFQFLALIKKKKKKSSESNFSVRLVHQTD